MIFYDSTFQMILNRKLEIKFSLIVFMYFYLLINLTILKIFYGKKPSEMTKHKSPQFFTTKDKQQTHLK